MWPGSFFTIRRRSSCSRFVHAYPGAWCRCCWHDRRMRDLLRRRFSLRQHGAALARHRLAGRFPASVSPPIRRSIRCLGGGGIACACHATISACAACCSRGITDYQDAAFVFEGGVLSSGNTSRLTRADPSWIMSSCSAASLQRSMIACRVVMPRSVMRTTTLLPFLR